MDPRTPTVRRLPPALWIGVFAILASLLIALALVVRAHPSSSPELAVMAWVRGWHLPGVGGFLEGVSLLGGFWPRIAIAAVGIAYLLISGRRRFALACAVAGGTVGLAVILGDYGLGEIVGRGRPVNELTGPSFPSGHTFGTLAFFGFLSFLAVTHGFMKSLRIPVLAVAGVLIVAVGASRIHQQAHWPSDVAAGYLLGLIALLALIPLYRLADRKLAARAGENL